jgi:hypothetical protein
MRYLHSGIAQESMDMSKNGFLLLALLLAGCLTTATTDVNSIWFKIRPGSRLVLNQPVEIPAGEAHVDLQNGQLSGGVDEYTVNCSLHIENLGPHTVRPDTFQITDTSDSQEWISQPDIMRYFKVLRLGSERQPEVLKLVCQDWAGPLQGRPVSVGEIEKAVGAYFTFQFAP